MLSVWGVKMGQKPCQKNVPNRGQIGQKSVKANSHASQIISDPFFFGFPSAKKVGGGGGVSLTPILPGPLTASMPYIVTPTRIFHRQSTPTEAVPFLADLLEPKQWFDLKGQCRIFHCPIPDISPATVPLLVPCTQNIDRLDHDGLAKVCNP